MKSVFMLVVMITLISQYNADADEWIGMEAEPTLTLGLLVSEDQAQNSTRTIYLYKQMSSAATLNIEISQDRLEHRQQTFDSENFFGQLDWWFDSDVNLALSYQFQGKKTELEVNQYALLLGYSPYPAFMSVEFTQGDVVIFTRDEIPPDRDIPERVQSDFDAITYHIGWWLELFSLSARHQIFDYQRDLSALGSRPLFQLLVKPAALVQSGLLMSDRTSISIDFPLNERRLSGHIMQTRSALNRHETRSLQLDWSEKLNSSTNLVLSVNRSDDEQDNWSFSIGLEWSS